MNALDLSPDLRIRIVNGRAEWNGDAYFSDREHAKKWAKDTADRYLECYQFINQWLLSVEKQAQG